MKKLITIALFIIMSVAYGQKDHISIGLTTLGGGGITLKTTDADFHGLELMLDMHNYDQRHELLLTGLIERQQFILTDRISNFYLYWGGGAHIGLLTREYDDYEYPLRRYSVDTSPMIGPSAIIGFEYRFESVPFEMALDNLSSLSFFMNDVPDLNIVNINFKFRYVFNHPKKLTL